MESLQVTDAISAAVAVAPRVTLDDIKAAIAGTFYTTGTDAFRHGIWSTAPDISVPKALEPLERFTMCVVVMRNGFVVMGKSAPASPENFNVELGRKFAYEDAVRQLWPLMGYALRDRLAAAASS
jgi:hypothetical protein